MNDLRKDIFSNLLLLGKDVKSLHISELNNQKDLKDYVIESDLLIFDYSKQRINREILDYLLQIPDRIDLRNSLDLLFKGRINNPSEGRGVSHTIYRNKTPINDFDLIFNEREKIKSFSIIICGYPFSWLLFSWSNIVKK